MKRLQLSKRDRLGKGAMAVADALSKDRQQ